MLSNVVAVIGNFCSSQTSLLIIFTAKNKHLSLNNTNLMTPDS